MISLLMNGAAGRMGRRILSCAIQEKDWKIVGAIEPDNSPFIGADAGELAGEAKLNLDVTSDLEAALASADVVIDFSAPKATLELLQLAVKLKKPVVIGTTGLEKDQLKTIEKLSAEIPILVAPNMSVGVNLLFELAGEVAKKLDEEYDIEIVEAHHRFKKDAPSGTAMRLVEEVVKARKASMDKDVIYGRHGLSEGRKKGEIAVHTLRGGDIVGDHTVSFTTLGERIELTHRAHSRDTFAKGSLRAARFLVDKKPGLYHMKEVLKGV